MAKLFLVHSVPMTAQWHIQYKYKARQWIIDKLLFSELHCRLKALTHTSNLLHVFTGIFNL